MKKIISLIPLLLLLVISCNSKDENSKFHNDLTAFNLNGNVKSVEEKSYEFVGGDAKGGLKRENPATYDVDLEFDKNQQLTSEKSYLSNGKLYESKTYEHKNKMLTYDEFLPNDVIYKTKYTYDADKNTIVSKRDKNGKQLHRTVNTFEKGLLTQKRLFDTNDELVERYVYKYDKKGNLIQAEKHNFYEILYKDAYSYDAKNNKVSEARFDKTGAMSYKTMTKFKDSLITEIIGLDGAEKQQSMEKREYDSKGNIIVKSYEDLAFNEFSKESYKYGESGNLTQWVQILGEKLSQTINYKYDSHKNLIQIERLDGNNAIQENKKFLYEYDESGNWIRKSIIDKDLQTYVIERKIQYY